MTDFDIPPIVAGMHQEAEYREVMAAAEDAAKMAARIVADDRPIEELAEKLMEDLRRRRDHPLGYDGRLTLAYALAMSVFASRLDAGSEERLRELGVWNDDEEGDDRG